MLLPKGCAPGLQLEDRKGRCTSCSCQQTSLFGRGSGTAVLLALRVPTLLFNSTFTNNVCGGAALAGWGDGNERDNRLANVVIFTCW